MTGFFETLAARAVGLSPALRPRVAHRFEPAERGGSRPGSSGGGGLPGAGPLENRARSGTEETARDAALGLEVDALVEAERSDPTAMAGLRRDDTKARSGQPKGEPAALQPSRSESGQRSKSTPEPDASRTLPGPEHRVARHEIQELARAAFEHTEDEDARSARRQDPAGRQHRTREARDTDDVHTVAPRKRPPEAAPSADDVPRSPSTESAAADPLPAGDLMRARPAAAAAAAQPGRSAPRGSRPRGGPGPAPGPDLDLAALLRDQVFAALVDRGAVPARERPVVVPPGKRATAPRPGTAAIRAEGVSAGRGPNRSARDDTAAAGPSNVHLHIDRVSVTRAAPPAPAPAPATRPSVDHAAYLARRRERG